MRESERWIATLACIVWMAVPAAVRAQERFSVRPAPVPHQSVRVTTAQEIVIDVDADASRQDARAAPMQLLSKSSLSYTQTNGEPDADGRIESQIVFDRFDMDRTINGKVVPPSALTRQIGGQSGVAIFDRDGRLLEIKLPPELRDGPIKQMLSGVYSFWTPAMLEVGQSVTVPVTMPMQLPGTAGDAPLRAETVVRLRSVDRQAGDRIARFEQQMRSATSTDSGQLHASGSGTLEVNLDRGFVQSGTVAWMLDGDWPAGADAAAKSSRRMRGTMKMTLTGGSAAGAGVR